MTSYTKVNTVCIKGIKEENWRYLKSKAANTDKTIGECVNIMIMEDRNKPKGNLKRILSRKPVLTDEEARGILEASKEFGKDFDFRHFK
jgi:hypothetical protein